MNATYIGAADALTFVKKSLERPENTAQMRLNEDHKGTTWLSQRASEDQYTCNVVVGTSISLEKTALVTHGGLLFHKCIWSIVLL
jgi:hypothetical protein